MTIAIQNIKKTALVVSALLEVTDINSCIEKLWNESEKDDVIAYCIFALIKCFNQDCKILLKELINYWIKVDDTKSDKNQIHTPRSLIYNILHPAIKQISDDAIKFLISLTENDAIAPYIAGLLENIDNPNVYAFKVKFYADNSHLLLNITDKGKNLSKETLDALKNIWDKHLIPFVVESFNSYRDKENGIIPLAEFLIRINPLDAENILFQCLENYKEYDYFWEVVIYIGTPKLIELAQTHFKNSADKIGLRLSLLHVVLQSDKKKFTLNKNILERIVNFMPYIKLESLEYLLKDIEREAFANDILNKIKSYIKEENKDKYEALEKNEEFFMKNLDEIYNGSYFSGFWILGLDYDKKYITISKNELDTLLDTLPKWLDRYSTVKAFNLCSHIIDLFGERKNYKILEQLSDKFIEEDKKFVKKILFNTVYGIKKESLSQ